MAEFLLQLPETDVEQLGGIRIIPGLMAAVHNNHIWVKGIPVAQQTDSRLWTIPGGRVYTIAEDGHVFNTDSRVPFMQLQNLNWQPLKDMLQVEPPVSAIKGALPAPAQFRLVRAGNVNQSSALLTDLLDLIDYAETAYRFRLQRLSYAVSNEHTALVLGTPLLPLRGTEYWYYHEMLLPCGYAFEYEITAADILAHISPSNGLVVFNTNGTYSNIPAQALVPVTRSGLRSLKLPAITW